MACHGNHDTSTSPSTSTSTSSGHSMGRMGLLMAACCLAPLAVILAIAVFGIPGSSLLSFAAVLLCPLMMVFMMRGHGHGPAQLSRLRREEGTPRQPMPQRLSLASRPRLAVLGALLLTAALAWSAGRFSAPVPSVRAQAAPAGYDIGAAISRPAPTGQVRDYQLVAREAAWEIAPGVSVAAVTYNGQVPGPLIRVTEGDTLRVTLKNELGQPTSIHWHGLHVPNAMDGVPPFTQAPIQPGETFTYEFTASHAGTFMYHSHQNAVEQIDRGLYGPLIIDPGSPAPATFDKEFTMLLSAWNTNAMPTAAHQMPGGQSMPGQGSSMGGGMNMAYNYFTINGKAFPSNAPWTVKEGDLVRVRIVNISNLAHPMHLHGHDFTVVAKDGEPIRPELQQTMNTLSVDAGETYDVVVRADNPGTWVWHCHELHHTENDGVEPGGLMQVLQYEGVPAPGMASGASPNGTSTGAMPATEAPPAPTQMPMHMPGMNH